MKVIARWKIKVKSLQNEDTSKGDGPRVDGEKGRKKAKREERKQKKI